MPPIPGIVSFPPLATAPSGPQVYIVPPSYFDNHVGAPSYSEHNFTLTSLIGVPSAWVWSIISGTGTVQAGQGTATATIRTFGACVIRCKATIGGGDYNPEASLTYEPGEVTPPSGGGGHPGGGGGLELF